ncbi:hypothetical protein GKE82_04465 [Conexibacter sp. W3-3-2]|uniref:DUF6580 family putative transport protein n=1 Tax=Conexibacter sp. W3-3-2 TaxID=2675227 RepID=UPI0012B7473A|nr:DUF6580 family putative transport protein [Conexibacter sp. W3-3-2]MTD43575.1 hypothetical protein [Conexibacter sp. W3-3-2]
MTWPLAAFTILGLALFAGFWWYERSHPTSKVLALVATLAALAALGRIAFAPLPNVKPTTDIVLLAGYVLGGAPGFAVGAVGALASNIVFGQGPWTPWQMGAWGLCGLIGAGLGALSGRRLGRWPLALACLGAGLIYGAILDFSAWVSYSGTHTLDQYLAISGTSLTFNLAHAIGNLVFCLAFGPVFVRALMRYRSRFEITWRPAVPASAAPVVPAALVALVLAGGLLLAAGPVTGSGGVASAQPRAATPTAEGGREQRGAPRRHVPAPCAEPRRRLRRGPRAGVEPPVLRLGRARPARRGRARERGPRRGRADRPRLRDRGRPARLRHR